MGGGDKFSVAARHAGELSGVKSAHSHHANVAERVDYLEKLAGDGL